MGPDIQLLHPEASISDIFHQALGSQEVVTFRVCLVGWNMGDEEGWDKVIQFFIVFD
jgi:hypothetical protein